MNWIKIKEFDSLIEAEFTKDLLEETGIKAVLVNKRDSMFLFGSYEIYVQETEEKKALAVIDEFNGLTKINSFVLEHPIRKYQQFLEEKGIETIFKIRTDPRYVLSNYEIYVKNELLEKVAPYLKPENIEGWAVAETCAHVAQTRYRIEMLEIASIDTMVLKQKNSNYHLEKIFILVPQKDIKQAQEVLSELKGWVKISSLDKEHKAEIREQLLAGYGIAAIIKKNGNSYDIYVKENDAEQAQKIIAQHKKWVKIRTYADFIDAQVDLAKLEQNNIDASIITIKDSMFLIGGYELYVDSEEIDKANRILSEEE